MSDYGADPDPDMAKAYDLAKTQGFMPQNDSNVMQWTLADDQVMRKLACRTDHSNIIFLIQE